MSWIDLTPHTDAMRVLVLRRYQLHGFACDGGVWSPANSRAAHTLQDVYIARPGGCCIAVVSVAPPCGLEDGTKLELMLMDMLSPLVEVDWDDFSSGSYKQVVRMPVFVMPMDDLDQAIVAAVTMERREPLDD